MNFAADDLNRKGKTLKLQFVTRSLENTDTDLVVVGIREGQPEDLCSRRAV